MKNLYIALFLILSNISYSQSPCPGFDSLNYGNQWYHTVQIGSQCWLRENLNIGTRIDGKVTQTDNGILEKYCYNDSALYCDLYGGLYQWNEALQYSPLEGVQGICPSGWHIPYTDELNLLINNVNTNGNALKAIGQGTGTGAGTNTSGFSGLLAGAYSDDYGYFFYLNNTSYIWGSTIIKTYYYTLAQSLLLNYNSNDVHISNEEQGWAFSIRCIKDNIGSLNLNTPSGVEQYKGGSIQHISWTSNNVLSIKIEYSTNNGFDWTTIVSSIPASKNSYNWTVPYTPSSNCKVRITDLGNLHTISISPNPFTIFLNVGTLTLLSPNGGENWPIASTRNITWTNNNISNVKIEFTTDNGITWVNIINSTPASTNSYSWLLPNSPSNNCKVKITDVDNFNTINISKDVFSMYLAKSQSCPGLDSICYFEDWYHTVQIGSQCWLKENLNVGSQIKVNTYQLNNDIIEKYCYNDDSAYCNSYGGTYQWREAVQYTLNQSPRGICPVGWHIPSDQEFNTLSAAVNNDGNSLKEVGQGAGTNSSGFSALLLGGVSLFWDSNNYLSYVGNNGVYNLNAGLLYLDSGSNIQVIGMPAYFHTENSISVRCLKDSVNLILQSPVGGESWIVGSKHNISWGGQLSNKKIKIEYTTNNGISWLEILNSTPAIDGNYVWTVPNTPSLSKVRITDLNNQNSYSISDKTFGIYNNPCPVGSIVHHGNHDYTTVAIGNICWFKENVNVGTMIPGTQIPTNNGILEKYCYNDDTNNCITYGALYKSSEMGEPGICPPGWHLPSENSFESLLNDILFDGNTLKAVGQGTGSGAGSNTSGFSALLAGDSPYNGLGNTTWFQRIFGLVSNSGILYIRDDYNSDQIGSVRCILDEELAVRSPYDGLFWQVGSTHNIEWRSSNVSNIIIEYSTDNGLSWINIIISTPASNLNYNWTIPNTPSKNCKIRIRNVDNPAVSGISYGVFTIFPSASDPCYEVSSISYAGRKYNTVAIAGLCWLKENLNVGIMIDSLQDQTNNGIIEKYCYRNDTANCNKYGGLYQLYEALQYKALSDEQGICPPDWYIPTINEFLGIVVPSVKDGSSLKDTSSGGNNSSGFSALMSGYRSSDGSFNSLDNNTGFWSSAQYSTFIWSLETNDNNINYFEDPPNIGFSIRCIHDYSINHIEAIVKNKILLPSNFALSNAYPNPWNPKTTIRYQVPINILVTIKLFDALGREVSTLVNEEKPAGRYEVTLNGKNLSSGVYFYQMKSGNFIQTNKIILIK